MKQNQFKFLVSSRLIQAGITSLVLSVAQARTWTSTDGTKTFEGELLSYDPRIGVVTVALASGTNMHFEQDKLSAADIAYVKTYFEAPPTKAAPLSSAVNLKDVPDVWPPDNEKSHGGKRLESGLSAELQSLKDEISRALPKVGGKGASDLENAGKATAEAAAKADAAKKDYSQIGAAKGGIDHAKGKWIGGANKNIAAAQAALKNAKSPAEKKAAESDLAAAQKNLADGEAALKERTAIYEAAKAKEPALKKAHDEAQAALAQAQARETEASKKLRDSMGSFLTSDALDGKLAKAFVLTAATPKGLSDFGEQSSENVAVVGQLLANEALMKEMIEAGGARFGKFGEAMKIFSVIQMVSPQAKDGVFRRLALATSLEHARPVTQTTSPNVKDQSSHVHPVKRYLHFEKAFMDGELDPAFKSLTAWEMRFVVNSEDPDEILAWGREMLRTYRPDHMSSEDYGWRYVSSVKSEVPYGSQNQQYDDSANHQHQNIIRNGGVCGRRAFFGRFILRSFGIPTWGVTQKAHAALSHWTPKGWVVNLGAGFPHSWWDKDEVKLSGSQFLLETQARAHTKEYIKIVRAEMVSHILGEPAYNERSKVQGGPWSNVALHQSRALAADTPELGALGQELAEANEEEQKIQSEAAAKADLEIQEKDGGILIPAVAHKETSGKSATMRSYSGGMQIHAFGGFKAEYKINAPRAGNYLLTSKIATAQTGQRFLFTVNNGQSVEQAAPYTIGLWQTTEAIPVTLKTGSNTLHFAIAEGSRGVTIKEFTLAPAK
jgi:predicted  nucleic acid-binding Zn-ribbon protein